MPARLGFGVAAYAVAGILFAGFGAAQQDTPKPHASEPVLITRPVSQSGQTSHRPLKDPREKPLRHPHGPARSKNLTDPMVQTYASTPAASQSLGQWEGLGVGLAGFVPTAVPPDPNMAVGPNHIVQWVNNSLVVFDKQGNVLQAPGPRRDFLGQYLWNLRSAGRHERSDRQVRSSCRPLDHWRSGDTRSFRNLSNASRFPRRPIQPSPLTRMASIPRITPGLMVSGPKSTTTTRSRCGPMATT